MFLVRLGAPNTVIGFLAAAPALGAIFLSVPAATWLEGRRDLVRIGCIGRVFMRLPLLAIAGAGFGRSLDLVREPLNFQIVFLISFLAGWATIHLFAQLRLPEVSANDGKPVFVARPLSPHLGDYVRIVREYPPFMRFVLTAFVYRIGLNLPVALFSIYWVREAHASNTTIGIQSTAANLALVVSYILWGRIAARRGHRIVLLIASAGTSLYPLATSLVRDEIWLVPVALVAAATISVIGTILFYTFSIAREDGVSGGRTPPLAPPRRGEG